MKWKAHHRPENAAQPIPYAECIAKSEDDHLGLTVLEHTRIVGRIARILSQGQQKKPRGVSFLAAAHDVGKVSPGFQVKMGLCRGQAQGRFESKHACISEAAFLRWAESKRFAAQEWGEALGAHHGTRQRPAPDACGLYGGQNWSNERQKLIDRLVDEFGLPPASKPAHAAQLMQQCGLVSVADWMGSDEELFNTVSVRNQNLDEFVQRAISECGWSQAVTRHGLGFGEIFPGFEPNELQSQLYEMADQRGAYVVEAPMGMGKTEAALYAAYRLLSSGQNRGLYFALPTRLTSNKIHERVAAYCSKVAGAGVTLAHGHAWLERARGGEELGMGHGWFHPLKRALLAPFGVGTIDQALLSVLPVKHAFVRAFGLAGKVVILDEVHAYDMYTGTLLDKLVELLLNLDCSVFILSATLTQGRKKAFLSGPSSSNESYPQLSSATGTVSVSPPLPKTIRLNVRASGDDVFEEVLQRAGAGQVVLWIHNTVPAAQACYRKLKSGLCSGKADAGLLHAKFPAFRRAELEDEWIGRLGKHGDRSRGCVLVATQIAEQSVDIDADYLVTELAPTDMLLQRMGRLWRHPRESRLAEGPETVVLSGLTDGVGDEALFLDALGPSRYIYAPVILWRTWQLWRSRQQVVLPRDIRALLEETYAENWMCPGWLNALNGKMEKNVAHMRARAIGLTSLELPSLKDDEESAPTRYNTSPQVQAILICSVDATGNQARLQLCDGSTVTVDRFKPDYSTIRALYQNMVAMPQWAFTSSEPPAWLGRAIHGACIVLRVVDNKLIDLDGIETGFGYHPDQGVYRMEGQPVPCEEEDDEFSW